VLAGAGNTKVANASASFKVEAAFTISQKKNELNHMNKSRKRNQLCYTLASFRRSSDPRVVFVAAFACYKQTLEEMIMFLNKKMLLSTIEITAATANRVGNKSAPGREGGGRDARGIDATGGRRSFGRGS
jgi:hypothetical protein